jgi:hypothetical protein
LKTRKLHQATSWLAYIIKEFLAISSCFVEDIAVFLLRLANGAVYMGPDLRSQWVVYWLWRDGELVLCVPQLETLLATKIES